MSHNRNVACSGRCRLPALLLATLSLCSSCSFFVRQPPLPRQAAIDSKVAGGEQFSALVQNADIIYFPSESVTLAARSEAAWKLLEALQRDSGSFVFGWDLIAGEEQPVLDEWAKRRVRNDNLMPRLHLYAASGYELSCRTFLQEASRIGAHLLALRSPSELLPAQSSEEFAAARIAEYFRQHPGEKMLVFLRRGQLGRTQGVPYLVAQKTKARQLVLNCQEAPPPRSRLVARN